MNGEDLTTFEKLSNLLDSIKERIINGQYIRRV
jgi:hypothetical protein